jgi:signal peptidase II
MPKKSLYALIFFIGFIADRLTKVLILENADKLPLEIFQGLSLNLAWNRGISWGCFNSASPAGFWILTSIIMLTISIFAVYSFVQYKNHHTIYFEMLVIAGALSNVVDRFSYGAVVDFIECSAHGWFFPTFNIADALIFIGVFGILFLQRSSKPYAR